MAEKEKIAATTKEKVAAAVAGILTVIGLGYLITRKPPAVASISLNVDKTTVQGGEQFTLSGSAFDRQGNKVPSATLILWVKRNGGEWRKIKTFKTDANGDFTITLTYTEGGRYTFQVTDTVQKPTG